MDVRDFRLALVALVAVVALGSTLDVMEVDAAQYASMSRDMAAGGNWLQLHHRGADYLDKPPLLFWSSALSFKLFGVHNWSYKLPSIAFAFLGLFGLYRFARLHHEALIARTAVLVFGCSAAFLLMTNDVRCDTILTASVITAVWLGTAWVEQGRWWQLLGGAVALAAGLLAKGPIGAVAPMLAVGTHAVATRRWRMLLDPRLLVALLLVAGLLLPMCVGLYEQHGLHGLRFYFWEQSFGRITGENRWMDDSTVLFFTHELPWQLAPWTLFVLLGIVQGIRQVATRQRLPEYASLCGALLVFLALSLSQFKLPHYLYVALPLFAVPAARAWHSVQGKGAWRAHGSLMILLWLAASVLVGWSFPEGRWPYLLLLSSAALAAGWTVIRRPGGEGWLRATVVLWIAMAMAVNGHFYPQLLRYQGNAQAGRMAAAEGLDANHFYGLQRSGTALDFYAGYPVPWISNAQEAAAVMRPGVVFWTDAQRLRELRESGYEPINVVPLADYPVQLLGVEMLDPTKRTSVVQERYLVRY